MIMMKKQKGIPKLKATCAKIHENPSVTIHCTTGEDCLNVERLVLQSVVHSAIPFGSSRVIGGST